MIEAICIIIFTLLFIFLAWKKFDWAIYFTIVFLPIYLLRFKVWFVPMTFLEVMVLIVFLVWLAKMVMQLRTKNLELRTNKEEREVRNKEQIVQSSGFKVQGSKFPWKWPALLFILVGVVAVLISPDTRAALGFWKAYILEPILFFIVFVNVVKTEKQIKTVVWALGASATLIGFGAFIQYIGLAPIPDPYGLQTPIRATSIFPFPTAIGKYVGPILALFLGLWLTKSHLKVTYQSLNFSKTFKGLLSDRFFFAGVIVFSLLGLILSFSRAALIGVFASLIFISFFSKWKKWIWLGLIIVVALTLIIPQTRQSVIGVFKTSDVSADVHLVMWKGAVRIIKANPITGTGLASFPIVYEKYKEASHTEFFPNPDNLILTLWIEMGLAGLVVFGWLIVRFFRAGVSLLRRLASTDYGLQLVVGLLAAMIAILVHGFFDTPYFKNDLAVEFWVLAGLMVVLNGSKGLEKVKG